LVCEVYDSACVWSDATLVLTEEAGYGSSWDWCDWWGCAA